MSDNLNDILLKIKSLAKCDSGYIFKTEGDSITILSIVGDIDTRSSTIIEISKLISLKNATLNEIYKSGYFAELNKERNYVSIFKEMILKSDRIYYYVVLFGKKKLPDVKSLRSQLALGLGKLKNKI